MAKSNDFSGDAHCLFLLARADGDDVPIAQNIEGDRANPHFAYSATPFRSAPVRPGNKDIQDDLVKFGCSDHNRTAAAVACVS
jgi:hypothetical protein